MARVIRRNLTTHDSIIRVRRCSTAARYGRTDGRTGGRLAPPLALPSVGPATPCRWPRRHGLPQGRRERESPGRRPGSKSVGPPECPTPLLPRCLAPTNVGVNGDLHAMPTACSACCWCQQPQAAAAAAAAAVLVNLCLAPQSSMPSHRHIPVSGAQAGRPSLPSG